MPASTGRWAPPPPPGWTRSRLRRFAFGFLAPAAGVGGFGAGIVSDGADWRVVVLVGSAIAVAGGTLCALVDPEVFARVVTSSQKVPSDETLKRGVSAFQIDGGRVPKPDEKPPRKYWDIGD